MYQGTNAALIGKMVSSARTFSMNQAVGTDCPTYNVTGNSHGGAPTMPVNGPWLDNSHRQHKRNNPWFTYGKASQVIAPGPSRLWVLLDEDQHGLNDAAFAFGMERPGWIDWPGTYHNFGCGFAFADGHSESKRWLDSKTRYGQGGMGTGPADPGEWRDWEWLRDRTSARAY